jgi:arsenite methyltransferase
MRRTDVSLQVYEPALCCSTGLCGPELDSTLVQFAADLRWLAAAGVAVERYNLAQQPEAFVAQAAVRAALDTLGPSVLPLLLRGGKIVSHGRYPSRAELEGFSRAEPEAVSAPGAARGGGCAPSSGCC